VNDAVNQNPYTMPRMRQFVSISDLIKPQAGLKKLAGKDERSGYGGLSLHDCT